MGRPPAAAGATLMFAGAGTPVSADRDELAAGDGRRGQAGQVCSRRIDEWRCEGG